MKYNQNQLAKESSPYLLQHADNPVEWHAWNNETLEKSQQEDKPLLISIGYSTCHWCHVMEKESFEDEEVARIMNENFICIKVDREERPDVDQLYMDAIQLMTGRGGWPLNCFALPGGKPFYGGTYFPKDQWKQLLLKVAELYANQRDDLVEQADKLTEGVRNPDFIKTDEDPEINEKETERFIENLKKNFDEKNGGIGSAPKFPLPAVYQAVLFAHNVTADNELVGHLEHTLEQMSRGGIYDSLGGGFARYSVDEHWKVPHFEKMLYDNAQLISLYSKTFKITQNQNFKKVVYETVDFLEREFMNEEGLFYSALDADSEGEEGKFYTWTSGEFQNVLGQYASLMARYFGIGGEGYWEKGKNILVRTQNNEAFAKSYRLSVNELEQIVEESKRMLFERRSYRTRPATDDKILTDWNALLASGLADAYEAFGEKRFLDRALQIVHQLTEKVMAEDEANLLYHSYKNNKARIPAFLDDYAFLAEAFFRIYENTFEEKWLEKSLHLVEYTIRNFYDEDSAFFFFTHKQNSTLVARKNNFFDNVTPSGNSVIFNLMYRLFMIYEREDYLQKCRTALKNVIPVMPRSSIAFSNWGVLLMRMVYPSYVAAIVGDKAATFRDEIRRKFLPNVSLAGSIEKSEIPVLKDRYKNEETLIYVCRERECLLPTSDVDTALEMLKPV
ncbi:MAG: thioredoxin domain-containing protein [Bacteroidales bacterium]|nr:thioredoxin domain-containing protein [Bacteroidales bacterium]MCF8333002.1 thioredoxin domain-containing protein [Bacteroidales bacterium]